MPIQVICPGCHTRFNVSDKFAGQSGACPKCKGPIEVPAASDKVVIHERELEAGAKDAQGRSVLKPVTKTDSKFNPLVMVGAILLVTVAFAVAFMVHGTSPTAPMFLPIMIAGALLVGPPLAWAGYFFLRDDELEGYQGIQLAIRTLACSVAYAFLWGVYAFVYPRFFGEGPLEVWMVLPLAPLLAAGAGAAYVCFDLDLGSGFFHYSLYLAATIMLRMVMGLPALGPAAPAGGENVSLMGAVSTVLSMWM